MERNALAGDSFDALPSSFHIEVKDDGFRAPGQSDRSPDSIGPVVPVRRNPWVVDTVDDGGDDDGLFDIGRMIDSIRKQGDSAGVPLRQERPWGDIAPPGYEQDDVPSDDGPPDRPIDDRFDDSIRMSGSVAGSTNSTLGSLQYDVRYHVAHTMH